MRFLQILSPIMVDLYKFAWLKFISSKFARLNLQWIASLLFSSGFSLKIIVVQQKQQMRCVSVTLLRRACTSTLPELISLELALRWGIRTWSAPQMNRDGYGFLSTPFIFSTTITQQEQKEIYYKNLQKPESIME